jgi:hypothetical protein
MGRARLGPGVRGACLRVGKLASLPPFLGKLGPATSPRSPPALIRPQSVAVSRSAGKLGVKRGGRVSGVEFLCARDAARGTMDRGPHEGALHEMPDVHPHPPSFPSPPTTPCATNPYPRDPVLKTVKRVESRRCPSHHPALRTGTRVGVAQGQLYPSFVHSFVRMNVWLCVRACACVFHCARSHTIQGQVCLLVVPTPDWFETGPRSI